MTSSLPKLQDLTSDNITDNVIRINSQAPDPRLKYVLERLVSHLHDFAREIRLSTSEWNAAIQFLTQVGQICTNVRQEFILLSDVLGLSLLVDSIDHPKPEKATEGTVLGPFHVHDAPVIDSGGNISHDADGEPCLVTCSVRDSEGNPVPGVKIDIWETDSHGFYDVQYTPGGGPDGRCVIESDIDGQFWFSAILPVPYPIPHDGPVGKLLSKLKRHPFRPSHMHFMFEKAGYDHLITSLFIKDSLYESSDAVFGVKSSLVVEPTTVSLEEAGRYGCKAGIKRISYDFVLVSEDQVRSLRQRNAEEAITKLGLNLKVVDGLPVPDLD